jgi:hypothetical protein
MLPASAWTARANALHGFEIGNVEGLMSGDLPTRRADLADGRVEKIPVHVREE